MTLYYISIDVSFYAECSETNQVVGHWYTLTTRFALPTEWDEVHHRRDVQVMPLLMLFSDATEVETLFFEGDLSLLLCFLLLYPGG